VNWLRVFRSAEAARLGPNGSQQLQTKVGRSEKCVAFRNGYETGIGVIAAYFTVCSVGILAAHAWVFSSYFKKLDGFTKLATSSIIRGWGILSSC